MKIARRSSRNLEYPETGGRRSRTRRVTMEIYSFFILFHQNTEVTRKHLMKNNSTTAANGSLNGLHHVNNFSIFCFNVWICAFNCEPSLTVMLALITGRVTPQARPRACLLRTNTYGTFLSSHNKGKCIKISMGVASAAMTRKSETLERTGAQWIHSLISSDLPRLSVFVASLAPLRS